MEHEVELYRPQLNKEEEEPSKQNEDRITLSTGTLAREDRELPQECFHLDQFMGLTPETNMNFAMMVLEKVEEEEKDKLGHCLEYVREIFDEHPYLLKEEGYDKPRKHEVVFSLNIDLGKRIYNRAWPLTDKKLKKRS